MTIHRHFSTIRRWTAVLLFIALIQPQVLQADWINLCQQRPDTGGIKIDKTYFKADGGRFWLAVTNRPVKDCESAQLGFTAGDIRWFGLIPADTSERIGQRIILQGNDDDEGLRVSEIIPDLPEQAFELRDTLGVARNLLAGFTVRSYGVEERATFALDGEGLHLNCRAGHKPAGILLDHGRKTIPPHHRLALKVSYSGQADFQLGIADQERFERGDPVTSTLPAAQNERTLALPYAKLKLSRPIHWSLQCPLDAASIGLHRFELVHSTQRDSGTQRDLWIWRPQAWQQQPGRVLSLLDKYQAKRVFISVPMDESKGHVLDTDQLRAFVAAARKRAIDVWAVEGDPHATLPRGQQQFTRRAQILQQYNEVSDKTSRLAGVQYDIEPYLVPGWSLEQKAWFKAYVQTLKQLRLHLEMPIEIVIPFWWQFKELNDEPLLDAVAPYIDSVNVMNYRTDIHLIKQFAQPFLEWGLDANRQVSIALEAGPIADESRWHYRKQKTGKLLHLKGLSYPLLILLNSEHSDREIGVFKQYRASALKGDVVSFQEDLDSLIKLLPEIESLWAQWPSFEGISLHGFEDELHQ